MTTGMLLLFIFGGFAIYMGLMFLIGALWGGKAVAIYALSTIVAVAAVGVIATWGVPL